MATNNTGGFHHSLQASAFIDRATAFVSGHPSVDASSRTEDPESLESILNLCHKDESLLREILATLDPSGLQFLDPTAGLVSIFDLPLALRTTFGRKVENFEERFSKYMIPLPPKARRLDGTPSFVNTFKDFVRNWNIFTEDVLACVEWDNMVVAGGAVCACLLPVGEDEAQSFRALRRWFHQDMFPDSDIDIFLYSMTKEQVSDSIDELKTS
jgi:hypothetical protein